MNQTKLTMEEKTQALTLLEQKMSVIHVAADQKVIRMVINLIEAAATVLLSRNALSSQGNCHQGLTNS